MKKTDYIILSVICFFLGIFLVSQYFSGKEYNKVIQPENNAVLALEVSKLTKSNAELRNEVQNLTSDLNSYNSSSESRKDAYDQYTADSSRLNTINGSLVETGQGVSIKVKGNLSTARIVDLINAIKNIGAEVISINEHRLVINTDLSQFSGMSYYEIKVLGNSNLLKTALERKGGIVEQLSSKDITFNIAEESSIVINKSDPIQFKYAKIIQ